MCSAAAAGIDRVYLPACSGRMSPDNWLLLESTNQIVSAVQVFFFLSCFRNGFKRTYASFWNRRLVSNEIKAKRVDYDQDALPEDGRTPALRFRLESIRIIVGAMAISACEVQNCRKQHNNRMHQSAWIGNTLHTIMWTHRVLECCSCFCLAAHSVSRKSLARK
jgi:hypothetical protein